MFPFMLFYGQYPLTPTTLRVSGIDNPKALKVSTTLMERIAAAKLALAAAQQRQKADAGGMLNSRCSKKCCYRPGISISKELVALRSCPSGLAPSQW